MSSLTAQTDFPGFVFAATVFAGGLMGYLKKGSVPSLVAGGGSAVLLAVGAYLNSRNPKNVLFSLVTSSLLTLMMGRRFAASGKFMPSGFAAFAPGMAVVGNTTAILATVSYVPPFQAYTSTITSYVGGPTSVATGSTGATGAGAVQTGGANPTVPQSSDDLTYVTDYLVAHRLSNPSYRYAFLLWFVLVALIILFSLCHHLGFRSGLLGSAWSKLMIGRKVIRSRGQKKSDKRSGEFLTRRMTGPSGGAEEEKSGGLGGMLRRGGGRKKRSSVLPSNGQLTAVAVLAVLVAVLCVVGDDYVNPSTSMWDLGSSFSKGASDSANALPYDVSKSWWTSGSRFGLIAFALMPLVILFALKAPPFALLSLRIFTHLYADKVALLHRWSGRILWLITTIHVALWTVQLFEDQRGNGEGRSMWMVVWIYSNFKWAVTGYAAMTALVATSLKSVRQRAYELFYVSHVILIVLTLLGSVMHYPPLWYWIAAAAALWVGERFHRLIRLGWINGWFGGLHRPVETMGGPRFTSLATEDMAWNGGATPQPEEEYGMTPINRDRKSGHSDVDLQKTLPHVPRNPFRSANPSISDFGAPGEYAQGTFDSRYSVAGSFDERGNPMDPFDAPGRPFSQVTTAAGTPEAVDVRHSTYSNKYSKYNQFPGSTSLPYASEGPEPRSPPKSLAFSSFDPSGQITPSPSYGNLRAGAHPAPPPPVIIPPGYAHAQLLPSRVVRLTIKVPRPFEWYAGQHVLLYVPEVSRWQSHPFSIVSAWQEDREADVVLIVKARKGFTNKLYELVRQKVFAAFGMTVDKDKRQSFGSMLSMAKAASPPAIMLRVLVDGPFGSVARARPGGNSSLIIVCGGSGVSFGIAGLLHFCETLARPHPSGRGRGGWAGSKFHVQRIRFVWIVREFAEIAWVSAMLKQCMNMAPPGTLQIDIFVTDAESATPNPRNHSAVMSGDFDYEPPRPHFAGAGGHGRPSSRGSVSSELSVDGVGGPDYVETGPISSVEDESPTSATFSILDLTNYEDEEDVRESRDQANLSDALRTQGRIMRARTRKGVKSGYSGRQDIVTPQPLRFASTPTRPSVPVSRSSDFGHAGLLDERSQPPQAVYGAFPSPHEASFDPRAPSPYEGAYPDAPARDAYANLRPVAGHAYRPSVTPSVTDSLFGQYDPFAGASPSVGSYSPAPSLHHQAGYEFDSRSIGGESGMSRPFGGGDVPRSRTNSMVLLEGKSGKSGLADVNGKGIKEDAGIWLDQKDYDSMMQISEFARTGRPKFEAILREEIDRAQGPVGVGTCGPASLNAVVRNTVARNISLSKIAKGDRRGVINLFSEDYES